MFIYACSGEDIMERTSVMVPPDLKLRAQREAKALGITFGEYVRRALTTMLQNSESLKNDPLFDDNAAYTGPAPKDISEDHDKYLYGRKK
jgi:hypothetical protein